MEISETFNYDFSHTEMSTHSELSNESAEACLAGMKAQTEVLGLSATEHRLCVAIEGQQLFHFEGEALVQAYDVSTSKNPPSCLSGSYGTPLGLHVVDEKYGDGEPLGTVFQSRKSIGKTFEAFLSEAGNEEKDCITTRILWLAGLEAGFNQGHTADGTPCDTKERYIYIHGTHDEAGIDRKEPLSHGCVRMKNADVAELYAAVPVGTQVWIGRV